MAKIIGNTTATPTPASDWLQTDEKKADYIKNKPEIIELAADLSVSGKAADAKIVGDALADKANASDIPTKISDLDNDSGFITSAPVTSVNGKTGAVTLLASDVGALPNTTQIPSVDGLATEDYVDNAIRAIPTPDVSGQIGAHNTATNSHNDIRLLIEGLTTRLNTLADSDDTTLDQMSEIVTYIKSNKSLIEGITTNKVNVSDIINNLTTNTTNKPLSAAQGVALKALIDDIVVPTKVSELTNDKNYLTSVPSEYVTETELNAKKYLTSYTETDPTVPSWAKQSKKPTYTANEVGAIPNSDITQEAGESESLVMSQKAVTKLVSDTLDQMESTEFETVNSIDEMTDKSKQYVLSNTGTVWTFGEVTTEVEPPNKFVPSTATLNKRLSGSSGSISSGDTSVGSMITDLMAVSNIANVTPYIARLNWEMVASAEAKVLYFNSSKTRIGNTIVHTRSNTTIENGGTVIDIKTMDTGSSVTQPEWADVAYVRFQLFVKAIGTTITNDDIANLTITFDADGETITSNEWYDTGMTPESASSGGNYVDLLVKVNENTSRIAEIDVRLTKAENGGGELTIPTFWQSAVDECISKIKALQVGRSCVTFPFFSDNHQRNGYSGVLIAHIMKECNIPYCFFGGDSISNGTIADEATMIEQDRLFDTIMSYIPNGRFCRAVGNHDGYWYDGTNKYYYTKDQIYELFLREESVAQDKHFGDDGTYYYVDDIASKVRFIVLNTNGSVDDTQLSWVQNTALSFSTSGWGVVFISHQPISNHYHASVSNATSVVAIVKNYINGTSANQADVIGWYSGHIHRDRIYTGMATNTSDDSVGDSLGFTQITITSDHTGIAYDDSTKHSVANDSKSHAIDFVTINKNTRTVNITRLGIGNDRSYAY